MRDFVLNPNKAVAPCPKCGNNTAFTAHSERVAEDCCEVWVVCTCGYDPTAENTGERLEDVMGGTGIDNILDAISCWNTALVQAAHRPKPDRVAGGEDVGL